MSQKSKNIGLIWILGLLVIISIYLGLSDNAHTSTIENSKIFAVQDTSAVDLISIKTKEKTIKLQQEEGAWMLNDTYKAEQNIVKVLLSILRDAEVVRNVPKTQASEVAQEIKENGSLVEISSNGKKMQTFYSAGNENKTISYMMAENEEMPMIVNIPGYESYVAGIFEITKNDWRDRTMLSTNWRTLQKLDLKYTEFPQYNFTIEFKFNFLGIDGIASLDTAKMMAYIEQFNYLQADRYLDRGTHAKYDSLLQTPETVSLSIADINPINSKSIDFYPLLPGDPMMLGFVKEDDQMVLFDAKRIQGIFAVKEEFEAELTQ
jgi:hypothetical protein